MTLMGKTALIALLSTMAMLSMQVSVAQPTFAQMANGTISDNEIDFANATEVVPSSPRYDIGDTYCYSAANVDFDVPPLRTLKISRGACCTACKQDDKCHYYTWSEFEGGTCWLKGSPLQTFNIKRGVTSSILLQTSNPLRPITFNPCDMPGNDLGSIKSTAADLGYCLKKCFELDKCVAYTWSNYNGGTCWFKSDVNECVRTAGTFTTLVVKQF